MYAEFLGRKAVLDKQLALLIEIHDYSQHGGPHHSVLILQGTKDGELVGVVGLHLAGVVEDLMQKVTRTPRARVALSLVSNLKSDSLDVSTLVNEYYAGIAEHRQWFRGRLLASRSTLSNDPPRWAVSQADRNVVIEWQDANPIPVYRPSERSDQFATSSAMWICIAGTPLGSWTTSSGQGSAAQPAGRACVQERTPVDAGGFGAVSVQDEAPRPNGSAAC